MITLRPIGDPVVADESLLDLAAKACELSTSLSKALLPDRHKDALAVLDSLDLAIKRMLAAKTAATERVKAVIEDASAQCDVVLDQLSEAHRTLRTEIARIEDHYGLEPAMTITQVSTLVVDDEEAVPTHVMVGNNRMQLKTLRARAVKTALIAGVKMKGAHLATQTVIRRKAKFTP